MAGRELRQRAVQSLDRLGLADAADRLVKTYSGGMQRRLDIALGLLHKPQVLFLDEPTTGLDPEGRVEIWREIERLAGEEQVTILLTTHYMEEADRLASGVAIIDSGRVVAQGSPEELKRELGGDTIQIELADPEPAAARVALERVAGLNGISLDGRTLRAHAPDGGAAIPSVLAALEENGVKAASVTLARPTLEDVYLRHAGRAFQDADREQVGVA
jgi:ABC-2 type transport system ATP-binding protein